MRAVVRRRRRVRGHANFSFVSRVLSRWLASPVGTVLRTSQKPGHTLADPLSLCKR